MNWQKLTIKTVDGKPFNKKVISAFEKKRIEWDVHPDNGVGFSMDIFDDALVINIAMYEGVVKFLDGLAQKQDKLYLHLYDLDDGAQLANYGGGVFTREFVNMDGEFELIRTVEDKKASLTPFYKKKYRKLRPEPVKWVCINKCGPCCGE